MGARSPELEKPKGLPTEIERKFVVPSLPPEIDLDELRGEHIEQGYLANGSGKNTVRLRKKEDKYSETVKWRFGTNPAERVELECELTEEQFDTFWPATEGRRIEKTRYELPYGDGLTIELDVFEGANAGYMLAEVEFASTDDAEVFEPPEWFGADVTADNRFGNANISRDGFPDISTLAAAA